MQRIQIIDSHTGGEPTRVVMSGGPDLGNGTFAERVEIFRSQFDRFRSAVVNEPRGSDVMVGGLLTPPTDPSCAAGIIFFNNVGYLGMCGHGTIGLMVTLHHAGLVPLGTHHIETPVGIVSATLHSPNEVSIGNVPSYRKKADLCIDVDGMGEVRGDLAWGGNWFFLVRSIKERLSLDNVEKLTQISWDIRQAINAQGYPEVDHIELFSDPTMPGADSKNFVLCPGKAYDRSPCGTGTSAKVACLAADGTLAEGADWVQESILGSHFVARYRWQDASRTAILPEIRGTAFVNTETTILIDPKDPFAWGISPGV